MLLSDGTSNEAYGQATASSAGPVTFIIDNGNGYPFVSGGKQISKISKV